MPKITKTRVGSVYLREMEPRRWRASWTDPLTKRHIRRMLPAASFEDAAKAAKIINKEIAQGRGFSGKMRGSVGHSVAAAGAEAIRHAGVSERTRRGYTGCFNLFIDYLRENAPGVVGWAQVSEEVVQNYATHCRRSGIAPDTIRLRVYSVKMTAGFMARTYPQAYRNAAAGLKLKLPRPAAGGGGSGTAILTPVQMRALLQWLSENSPMIHVWAVLQGLCGLRQLEAAYLREQDFDAAEGMVTVAESSAHKPKTAHSHRTIPVPPAVQHALAGWIAGMRVKHAEGYLFIPSRSTRPRLTAKNQAARVGVLTVDAITHLWRAALDRAPGAGVVAVEVAEGAERGEEGEGWSGGERADVIGHGKLAAAAPGVPQTPSAAKTKLDLPAAFTPRHLRATFVTAMRSAGVDLGVLQSYIGHAPQTILAAHYDQVGVERLKRVAEVAEQLYKGEGAFEECSRADAADTAGARVEG